MKTIRTEAGNGLLPGNTYPGSHFRHLSFFTEEASLKGTAGNS